MSQTEDIRQLREAFDKLKEENIQLISRNLQLSEQLCMWYEMRQRVNWLKDELQNNQRMILKADMADDAELLAIIETRLEQEPSTVNGEFDAAQLAQMLGVSQNSSVACSCCASTRNTALPPSARMQASTPSAPSSADATRQWA